MLASRTFVPKDCFKKSSPPVGSDRLFGSSMAEPASPALECKLQRKNFSQEEPNGWAFYHGFSEQHRAVLQVICTILGEASASATLLAEASCTAAPRVQDVHGHWAAESSSLQRASNIQRSQLKSWRPKRARAPRGTKLHRRTLLHPACPHSWERGAPPDAFHTNNKIEEASSWP